MNARAVWCSALVIAVSAQLVGCKSLLKKREAEASDSASAAAAPPAPPPAPVATPSVAQVADEQAVPTPQDFEDEAFAKVTTSTYKTEFARLKKEIEAK
jgi:hypothetical protein